MVAGGSFSSSDLGDSKRLQFARIGRMRIPVIEINLDRKEIALSISGLFC
jgi:hypothetical protein